MKGASWEGRRGTSSQKKTFVREKREEIPPPTTGAPRKSQAGYLSKDEEGKKRYPQGKTGGRKGGMQVDEENSKTGWIPNLIQRQNR